MSNYIDPYFGNEMDLNLNLTFFQKYYSRKRRFKFKFNF